MHDRSWPRMHRRNKEGEIDEIYTAWKFGFVMYPASVWGAWDLEKQETGNIRGQLMKSVHVRL